MDYFKLVTKAQNKDAAAFGEIYDIFAGRIFRYVKLRVKDQQQAEDILQEVFIKAWKALPQFRADNGNFSAWLYKIAGNTINDYFRKLYRSPATTELHERLELAESPTVMAELSLSADMEAVKKSMELLHPAYRQVLELRFVQEFSVRETADILNKSGLAVRLIQHRALKKLRAIINEDYDPDYSKIS